MYSVYFIKKSRAGLSARRIQFIAHSRNWSAQRPTLLLGYEAAATAAVLAPIPHEILIHEDEYEKNLVRSHAHVLRPFLFSAFRIPTSEFPTP